MEELSLRFREMSNNEFEKFIEISISDYSKDLIKSGVSSEENAFESSKKQFDELLPQGRSTENNSIYVVVNNENEDVGTIWYKKHTEDMAFICDFLIFENQRKKGYGKQTLLLLDRDAKEKGFNKILLHVFKFNETASSLYKAIGYKTVKEDGGSIFMVKDI